MSATQSSVDLFYSYAHEDEPLRDKLEKHLSLLQRQGIITSWHSRQIVPGTDWAQAIDAHLERASVILLLISADFLDSDYCYGVEMKRALKRHQANQARVIPILLRPVDWKGAPFAHLQVLPTNAKAVTTWKNRDQAFADVAAGLRRAIEDLSLLEASAPRSNLPPIWNIPYPRNSFFLGRDDLLSRLRMQLQVAQATALSQPQAISGLGGIGKTQIAIEYAYRYHQNYQAVLWTRADTVGALVSGFVALAELLQVSQQGEQNQHKIVQAVKDWLKTHDRWLLILDNADDPVLVRNFLPTAGTGHVLLTTRAASMGRLASRIEVETLDQETGSLFLLRRAGVLAADASLDQATDGDLVLARELVGNMGGLPLALDQAGAYIEETQCNLADYLYLYGKHRAALLKERGGLVPDHPESVATTWSLSFQRVEKKNPAATDLLRVCALLQPDAIPEEIILEGAQFLGSQIQVLATDPLAFNRAINALLSYSLIRRNSIEHLLSVHRLVQAVLCDAMGEQDREQWTERAIAALNAVFPAVTDYEAWGQCERLLPHVLTCEVAVTPQEHRLELAFLLAKTADYLRERARFEQAEPLYQRALHLLEQALGSTHPDVASPLNGLAKLYRRQGKYEQAEPLFQRALHNWEQALGPEHLLIAYPLNNLATIYQEQGKYEQAEPLFQRALTIRQQQRGTQHPETAESFHDLAHFYEVQKQTDKALALYQQALAIREQQLGPEHPRTVDTRTRYAHLLRACGRAEEADALNAASPQQAMTSGQELS